MSLCEEVSKIYRRSKRFFHTMTGVNSAPRMTEKRKWMQLHSGAEHSGIVINVM
jgi:hypothetical protein